MNLASKMMLQLNKPVEQDGPFSAEVLVTSGTTFEPPIELQIHMSSVENANSILEDAIQNTIQSYYKVLKIDGDKSTDILEELVEAGRTAFEEIVQDDQTRNEIAAKLRGLSDGATITIMLDRQQPIFLPWEFLVYDYSSAGPLYQNFWGHRHVICRQAFSGYPNFGKSNPALQPRLALLASEGLFYVDSIKRPYLRGLAEQERITYIDFASTVSRTGADDRRRQRRFSTLLNGRDLRIADFACCIIPVDNTRRPFRILLHNDMELDLREIRQHVTLSENKLVVLLNFRLREESSGLDPQGIYPALHGPQSFYWVDAFLELGAAGVIAANCGIPDLCAATFARSLYQHLTGGSKVGEALLKTRQDMLELYQNPLGLAYTLYIHPDEQLFRPRESKRKKPVAASVSGVPAPIGSLRDVVINGVSYHIDDGAHLDIIEGLQVVRLDTLFTGIPKYREKLWAVLSRPQDDTAYKYVADLWMGLWVQEGGLPPFSMVQLLAEKEYSGDLYKGYRDHVVHSLLVYLLGLHLYYSNEWIQESMKQVGEPSEFLRAWKIAALFHDIGYCLSVEDRATAETQKLLLEQLQRFAKNPLRAYGEAHRTFRIAGADATAIRRQAGSCPVWELNAFTDLRQPFAPAQGHILDDLDDLVRGANLADHGERRYCYRYDEYARNTHADTHPRCDDHGMVSAMILLGLHTYFRRYADVTCKPEVLEGVRALPVEARKGLPKLPEIVKQYTHSVRQAAAAIALHNVHVTGWTKHDPDWSKARSEPYYLTLDQYRLSLDRNPLAWLLALTDALQCWDRPSRTEPPLTLKDCTMKHQEIRIVASSPDRITVSFLTDDHRDTPGSRFRKLIDELRRFMDDLHVLEEGTPPDKPL